MRKFGEELRVSPGTGHRLCMKIKAERFRHHRLLRALSRNSGVRVATPVSRHSLPLSSGRVDASGAKVLESAT